MKTKELYDRACVQIDAQAEHIGELMKENAILKEVGKERDEFYLKYIAEAEENAKLRKSRDKLAENLAVRTLWIDEDRNKDKVKQSWAEWSEKSQQILGHPDCLPINRLKNDTKET
jgi:hypothetical protein